MKEYWKRLKSLNNFEITIIGLQVILLLAIFVADVGGGIVENMVRRTFDGQYWKLAAVMVFSGVSFLSILLASMVNSLTVRLVVIFFFLVTFLVNRVTYQLTGGYLDVEFISSLLETTGRNTLLMFLNEYFSVLTTAVGLAFIIMLFFVYTPHKAKIPTLLSLPIPILMFSIYVLYMVMPGMNVAKFSSSLFSLPYQFPMAVKMRNMIGRLERIPLQYNGRFGGQMEKIVLLIDESVAGSSLTINGGPDGVTPYLSSGAAQQINFGLATSYTNRSAPSKLLLRSGLSIGSIPDTTYTAFTKPNLWQFAKKAGYRTVFIDAWPTLFQDFVTAKELTLVDEVYGGYEGVRAYSDFLAAESLKKILARDGKFFIIVLKEGVHWPYANAYPRDWRNFSPVVKGVNFIKMPVRKGQGEKFISKTQGLRPLLEKGEESSTLKELYKIVRNNSDNNRYDSGSQRVNAYLNAVNWSVDHFFRFLLEGLDMRRTIIIHTSDHGQYVNPKNPKGGFYRGHGSIENPKAAEGIVPLLLFTEQPVWRKKLERAAEKSFNKMTHDRIFPTITRLMGYEPAWVKVNVGETLLDPAPAERFFFYGPSIFRDDGVKKMVVE
ncbi:MAG TPA: hypothetical protein ENI62_08655 [Gammaproteobacteria bacterium]|nr:hypothetical protein [Gammaproteobacteria bacterium]